VDTAIASITSKRLTGATWGALVLTLVVYPIVYCSGIMGALVRPIITEHSRLHWWYFWIALLLFHWIPFGAVWWALRREGESWSSIGVDWSWFWRRRWIFAAVLGLLVMASLVMPRVHYGGTLPPVSKTLFMAPVSAPERLFVLLGAITAGVTEEVLFRGFAITRLTRLVRSPWLALPITVVSFLFIHGKPRGVSGLVSYTMAGLAFGVPFILMGQRRLEILIAIHFAIDASMVFAP
jgi:membrane protease YdiL (CAAX protease family)